MILTHIFAIDFVHVMDFLESHDMKDTYPYDKQCLVILDLVLPVTSHPTFTTKSKLGCTPERNRHVKY